MLTLEPFSEDQGRSAVHPARGIPPISFLAPCGFTHPLTRTHVRLLGPCFKTGRMGCPQAGAGSTQVYRRRTARAANHDRRDGISTSLSTARALAAAPIRTGPRPESIGGRLSPFHIRPGRIAGPHSLPSRQFQALFDSLFKVPFHLSLAVLVCYRSHAGDLGRSAAEDASPDYNSDSEAVRFSSWADPGSLAVTKGILVHVHGSFCFAGFDNDPSAGSPTETLLRLLLPLNDKVQWNSRDVAGGEPPTLRSRSLTELTRQIAPPTKNGHAPPPIESRKSSQSVNPYYLELPAAAGTRLALQWILVKGFRLYSFQLPDSFEPGIVIYCHYLPVSGLGNLRACCLLGCGSRSQAPSPESNPNSPSPVTTIVGHYPTIES
ncbi:hypothetical protein L1887_43314 [Cichorium endivia]|nr:hypothetical protein L1887_43314 [Cichorium endivia]